MGTANSGGSIYVPYTWHSCSWCRTTIPHTTLLCFCSAASLSSPLSLRPVSRGFVPSSHTQIICCTRLQTGHCQAPLQMPSGLTWAVNNYFHSTVFQSVLLLTVAPSSPSSPSLVTRLSSDGVKRAMKAKCKCYMFFLLNRKSAMLPWKRSSFVICSSQTHVDCCLAPCHFLVVYKQFDWWIVSPYFWDLTLNWFVYETFQSSSFFSWFRAKT